MHFIGIDVGGANIKVVVLDDNGRVVKIIREYLPLWKVGKTGLEKRMSELAYELCDNECAVAVCMTAELCDIYESKSEGVKHVVDTILSSFKNALTIRFVTVNYELVDPEYAKNRPLEVAAANWAASAWLVSRLCKSCIFADIGSTTTTIIPVHDGRPLIRGLTDPEKLVYGELVYIGTLRTSVSEIIQEAPYKGHIATICREYFATIGDVNLLLGKIRPEDYAVDTADRRGKTIHEAANRLARVLCSSLELMNLQEVVEFARYVYNVAIMRIAQALIQVRTWLASRGVDLSNTPLITAGIGEFMLQDAGKLAGFENVLSIDDLVKERVRISPVVPSYGAALMLYDYIKHRGMVARS